MNKSISFQWQIDFLKYKFSKWDDLNKHIKESESVVKFRTKVKDFGNIDHRCLTN